MVNGKRPKSQQWEIVSVVTSSRATPLTLKKSNLDCGRLSSVSKLPPQVAQAPKGAVNMTLRNSVIFIRVCMGIERSYKIVQNRGKRFNKIDLPSHLLCITCVSITLLRNVMLTAHGSLWSLGYLCFHNNKTFFHRPFATFIIICQGSANVVRDVYRYGLLANILMKPAHRVLVVFIVCIVFLTYYTGQGEQILSLSGITDPVSSSL